MDAALAALLGTGLGALGSIGGAWLKQRHEVLRDRVKLASELGLAEYQQKIAIAKASGVPTTLLPLSMYVDYHLKILEALESGGLDAEKLVAIKDRQTDLIKVIHAKE